MERVLALLYDIHGNLPALEAVLADARRRRRASCSAATTRPRAPGRARPSSAFKRARERHAGSAATPTAGWWTATTRPTPMRRDRARTAELLGDELVARAGRRCPEQTDARRHALLPRLAALGHAELPPEPRTPTPSCSTASTARRGSCSATRTSRSRAPGPAASSCVNPGSVGMPLDGDHRAAYALVDGDGAVEQPPRGLRLAGAPSPRGARAASGELPARRIEQARFDVS